MIAFFIFGIPRPQGNHSISRSGHIYESTKDHRAWRRSVAQAAMLHRPRHPLSGPVAVSFRFELPRPLRNKRPLPSVKPDLVKLIRNVEDGLVDGQLLADDADLGKLLLPGGILFRCQLLTPDFDATDRLCFNFASKTGALPAALVIG